MNTLFDAARFAQVARRFAPGAALLRAWPLTGGISAEVTALEIMHTDGRVQTVIVRQHGAADRRANPQIAAAEFRLLAALQRPGCPCRNRCCSTGQARFFSCPTSCSNMSRVSRTSPRRSAGI